MAPALSSFPNVPSLLASQTSLFVSSLFSTAATPPKKKNLRTRNSMGFK
jgi:hypothetical protein